MCGTPAIVTEKCGCDELVKKSGAGYSVPYGDTDRLKKMMMWLLENPEEAKEMVKKGKKFIEENFAWDKVVTKMEKIYELILET
jgi:glycosyltransferase involved in cell wall biosynthesis